MKKHARKFSLLLVFLCLFVFVFAGCGGEKAGSTDASSKDAATTATTPATTAKAEPQYVEYWPINQTGLTWEKDGPVCKWLIERCGVGYWSPLVIWDGANGYYTKLQTRIATGDLPDIFKPVKGIETSLIKEGLIWEISEYLPKYAPNIWKQIPESIWNTLRSNDPTGKNGIYYIPGVMPYNSNATFIRKDWLDKLGLAVPTNQAEYVEALKAFRDRDPNGNGQKDELPTTGREFGKWMDHLFYMYDVAMTGGGNPAFDVYDGEITYSAVTPNMKAALIFIRDLYKEKLLDSNTFLNKANDLWAVVGADKVGSWFHLPYGLDGMALFNLVTVAPDADVVVLPPIAAEGYKGQVTRTQIEEPTVCFGKNDEKQLINGLIMLDWIMAEENMEEITFGVEGLHYKMENGKKVAVGVDENTTEKKPAVLYTTLESLLFQMETRYESMTGTDKTNLEQGLRAVNNAQGDLSRVIAQDGMPNSVYDGYPDILALKLYQEYMTQIIIGEWPIEKFDEFVEKWYSTGGTEVTKRVREWYAKVQAQK